MADTPATLDHIRVRFATFRDRPADARAEMAARLADLDSVERVLLDTCHRVELVSVDAQPAADDVLSGREAVRRVFEVVAGFDSAVVAEEQLLGQARAAYESALDAGRTGPVLNELFRRALRFGRRVRAHARPGADRSLADPGLAWLEARLSAAPGRVVVAGTGDMGRRAAERLARAGHRLTIVSASEERGRELRDRLSGDGHEIALGPPTPGVVAGADAIVLAVRTRAPQLTAGVLDGDRPWVLDFSSPAAVSADAAQRLGDRLLSLEQLATLAGGSPVLGPAVERRLRRELEDEVERYAGWLAARSGADALAVLHDEAERVRRRHLDRLRRRGQLDARQLEVVEAAAAAMVGELLHGPTVELRRGGADAAAVRRLFGLPR